MRIDCKRQGLADVAIVFTQRLKVFTQRLKASRPFSEEKLLNHENQAATAHPHFLDGGDWIGREEPKHFHKLKAPLLKELKAFIHSRTFATVRPPQGSGIRWKRDKTLLTMAWEC